MKRLLTLTIIGTLAMAASASAHLRVRQVADYAPLRAETTHLVTPSGQPVRGPWQQWVDEARAPTVHGLVILALSAAQVTSYCHNAEAVACAQTWAPYGIYAKPSLNRSELYHDLGHLFDAENLTDAGRAVFMRLWGWQTRPGQTIEEAWWSHEAVASSLFGHGPPAEWFAEGYRLCATYGGWTWNDAFNETWFQYGYPAQLTSESGTPVKRQTWALHAQRATCLLIHAAR